MNKTVKTTWDLYTYDVWGNTQDGYEVNDKYSHGNIEIKCKIEINNPGTNREFLSAFPSDYQLSKIFSFTGRLDISGDDLHIYVNRDSDWYPLGELICTSHASLSPIRPI